MPTLPRRPLLAGLLAAAALSAPAAAQSPPPLKIAVMGDMSGPYADNGGPGSVLAATMAIEDFGKTVLGRPIQLMIGDDQNKPDIGVAMARKWLNDDKVDAILTFTISPTALGVQPLMTDAKKPHLIAGTGTADLTGKACSPMAINFVYDTYVMPKAIARALVAEGKDTWFFITVDYAFGAAMENAASHFVREAGGRVLGSVKHPLGTTDFASQLLAAQASGAKVVAFANAGADFSNVLKQAGEFGLTKRGQVLASTGTTINTIVAVGLEAAQGMQFTVPFYWDMDEETRAWSRKFMARFNNKAPTFLQSGAYSAVWHYLNAVKAAGTTDGEAVMAKMKATPINDFQMKNVPIRADGHVLRPMFLAQVKSPAESKEPYDVYRITAKVAPDTVWRTVKEAGCAFAQN
jgi:branched-chain amino acid transport system substrate-binding protein